MLVFDDVEDQMSKTKSTIDRKVLLVGSVLLIFLVFSVVLLCCVCLRHVSCVSNVPIVS